MLNMLYSYVSVSPVLKLAEKCTLKSGQHVIGVLRLRLLPPYAYLPQGKEQGLI